MKNNYLLVFTFLICALGYSQAPIVTVDRPNIIGPTATGNTPEISSSGFVRGSGVILATTSANFTASQWNASNQADAATNNEYIEWSVSASADNSVEVTELDTRNRRNANGPANWQIFYSLDNFATAGIPVTTIQTSTDTASNSNFNGLSIVSGTAGTITFRLYAWNSLTNNGWFRIAGRAALSDFGIATPGLRITGTVTTTAINDTESNIVSTSFDPTDNIDYTLYDATSGLTTTNAIKIGEFTVQDGGDDLTDADTVPTILTDLGFNVSNSANLAALAIFDGSTNISEVTTVTDNTLFEGISGITAPDNGSKTFDVYATFNATVTDNDQIQLTINSANADALLGSTFDAFDAGGAQTPIAPDDNKIEVVATALVFDQEPVDSFQFETMNPSPVVNTVDANGNIDLDFNGTISVVSGGSLEPGFNTYAVTNGVSIFDTIVFSEKETGTSLITFGGGLITGTSTTFNIDGPLITIAQQDFDSGTPDWTYSSNVALFDNGWGTDGYYGVIDINDASPLDNPLFSNNIFGENDLNDEGDNGATGFATLTFDTIDISNFDDVKLSFDWDVHGYVNNNDDAQYRLIYDGTPQAFEFLLDGNDAIDTDEGSITIDIPSAVSTISLQVRVRNNGINGYSGFDNFKLSSVFNGLLYEDNGWSPNPPSASTGLDNAYVLDGTYIVGSNIELNNLYVNEIGATTISAGQSVTTNSGVVNFGLLELNSSSTSYSSLIADKVQGEVIYNRHVNQFADSGSTTGKNDLVSAPVTDADQTFLALRTVNPDIPSGTIGGVPSFLFGPFDRDANNYINYTSADDPSLIELGIGYRTASDTPTGSTFRFVGNVETETKLVPITVGAGSEFNLIGNPYPSYIKLSDFLSTNNSEFSATNSGVYGYDGDLEDGFVIWNQAYSDANPTAVMAAGQGFFVASKAGGGTITFTPTMRSIGTTDDFVVGRLENNINLANLRLELSTDNDIFRTDVYFNDNATLSMDSGYDTAMFNNVTPDFAIYSHLVNNNNGLDLAVQSVNYDAINDVIIPLGVNANQGVQLSISILESNIPNAVDVYLEDTVTNTFTLLNDSEYIFTPSVNLSGTGRFFLRFSAEALSTSEENFETIQIYTTKTPKTLFIKGALQNDTMLEIYDIQGRMILNSKLDTRSTSNQIDISGFTSGIYVVKLNNGISQKSQKVIIK
nr:T9SS type A sorting domain-containing protein [uncultured Psychroserpens sp.]